MFPSCFESIPTGKCLCKHAAILIWLLLFPTTTTFGSEHLAPYKIECSTKNTSQILTTAKITKSYLVVATKSLLNTTPEINSILKKWIGDHEKPTTETLLRIMKKAYAVADEQKFWCPLKPNNTPAKLVAFRDTLSSQDIFLLPQFFKLPVFGKNSKPSTILHELLHHGGADLEPEIYNVDEVLLLAKNNSFAAKFNAQSIEFLIVDLYEAKF